MKWDAITVALLVVAAFGIGLAVLDGAVAPSAAAGGAALAAAAGVGILVRGALEGTPRTPRHRIEAPTPAAPLMVARLDRDAFARRGIYDSLATMSSRLVVRDRWPFSAEDAERVCGAPPEKFRAWVSERLDELEEGT
jgi:hypothetical protein